jgi:D-beta-D-heptose 7-phosphate kinase/D-beta-D-heptose 1-phosphate adenosyltransferase
MNEQNIQQQKQFRILLIGDNCTDVYQYGTIDRLSPEAPVPVFVPTRKEERAGMAGNVYANLLALGCSVKFIHGDVSVKERLIDERSKQQIVRIDKDVKSPPLLLNKEMMTDYDAIVISDYNKGSVTYELIEQAIRTKIAVFVDTKKTDLERMQGAWVKINELEFSKIKTMCTGLIVTKGDKGAEAKWHSVNEPAPVVEVVDVTGAGDTFLAAYAYKFLDTQNVTESIQFAIKASSITVQHVGCYAPLLKEIQ